MRRATFNVLYYIYRTKVMKDGKVPILARLTLNKQRAEFATGRHVEPDLWNAKLCKVVTGTKEAREINTYLDLIKSNLLLKKKDMEGGEGKVIRGRETHLEMRVSGERLLDKIALQKAHSSGRKTDLNWGNENRQY